MTPKSQANWTPLREARDVIFRLLLPAIYSIIRGPIRADWQP